MSECNLIHKKKTKLLVLVYDENYITENLFTTFQNVLTSYQFSLNFNHRDLKFKRVNNEN